MYDTLKNLVNSVFGVYYNGKNTVIVVSPRTNGEFEDYFPEIIITPKDALLLLNILIVDISGFNYNPKIKELPTYSITQKKFSVWNKEITNRLWSLEDYNKLIKNFQEQFMAEELEIVTSDYTVGIWEGSLLYKEHTDTPTRARELVSQFKKTLLQGALEDQNNFSY